MLRATAVIAIAAATASSCQATLVEWDGVAGASQPATDLVSGVTGQSLTRGAGIAAASGGNFNSNGFGTSSPTLTTAITENDYLTFGATADAGFALDFESIEVEMDRSGTGPSTVYLLSSIDGFTDTAAIASFAIPDPGAVLVFDLTSLAPAVGTTEFRFYYSGASSSGGTSDIEDDLLDSDATGLRLSGRVIAAVPEPTAALFGSLLAGALGMTVARRPNSRD